jgi:TolB-like protein/Flp pilus assembly protein TadD
MKRCPECRRDYHDDSLAYCLDDGSVLVDGPNSPEEPATAIQHETSPFNEAPTKVQVHATDQTAVLPSAIVFRGNRRRVVVVGFAAAFVAIFIATTWVIYRSYRSETGDTLNSIAVLPFTNASGDPNAEYLSDGISEALINSLTDLRQLRVVARATAFRYKGREMDPQAVGRELNVRAVLMGTVKQVDNKLDIQVDLVDVDTGAQIWGQDYISKPSDLLSVKHTIAGEIIDKLRVKLSGDDRQKIERRDTSNSEAYKHYLRGLYFQNQRTAEAIAKAIDEFQQALANDPNYALGYVGLADSYTFLEQITGLPASESLPKARAAADRALEIDSSSAEAHTSSAKVYEYLWRWSEAEEEYRRSISLNPNYPRAHQWFALFLRSTGRFDEAMSEIKRAQELDPLSPIIGANAAFAYLIRGEFEAAIEQDRKVIELEPSFWVPHVDTGWAYLKLRRFDEATAEFQKAIEMSGRASIPLGSLGYCYAVTGRKADAVSIAKELEERYTRQQSIGFNVATVYAGLGEKDQVFAWLEKDFAQHSSQLPYITWWPNFDDLRGDPRYANLVSRMGLPQAPKE